MGSLEHSWGDARRRTDSGDRRLATRLSFGSGAALMGLSVAIGNTLQGDLGTLGVEGFLRSHGALGWAQFLVFALGFPLGAGLCALAPMLASEPRRARRLWFAACVVLVALASVVVPGVFGRHSSPVFFAAGGYLLLALLVLVLWLWGSYRRRLSEVLRPAADLQAAGYLSFAAATWNLCGLATMPSFGLDPSQMMSLGAQGFALGQAKAIMALLIMGWILTAWGYRKAAQADRRTQT